MWNFIFLLSFFSVRLCKAYLEEYMHPDQLDGELMLAPGFAIPPNMDYQGNDDLYMRDGDLGLTVIFSKGIWVVVFPPNKHIFLRKNDGY